MRIKIVFLVLISIFLSCKKGPPKVSIMMNPKVREIMAGSEIRAWTDTGLTKEKLIYRWSSEGACQIEFQSPDLPRTNLKIPSNCQGGIVTIKIHIDSDYGIAEDKWSLTVKPNPYIPKPLELRPSPLPETWKMVNDYEEIKDPRQNLWGGFYSVWNYRGGTCSIIPPDPAVKGILRIKYNFLVSNSMCGYFDYLKGEEGKAEPVDISNYEKITFLVKSGDGKNHKIRIEVIEFDKFQNFNQGHVASSDPIDVTSEWKRHELYLKYLLPEIFKKKEVKQIGFRIDRKEQGQNEGIIYFDNFAFILKTQ